MSEPLERLAELLDLKLPEDWKKEFPNIEVKLRPNIRLTIVQRPSPTGVLNFTIGLYHPRQKKRGVEFIEIHTGDLVWSDEDLIELAEMIKANLKFLRVEV